MLDFQVVARQTVIKLLFRWLPVDQVELFSVMLQVTTDTIFAIRIGHLEPGMISMPSGDALCHFLVTVNALEGWRAGTELMTACALCGPTEGLMGLGERTGRDLSLGEMR